MWRQANAFGWVCMLDERITPEMRWTLVKYEQNVPSSRIRTESDNGNLVFGFATFLLPLFPLYSIYIHIFFCFFGLALLCSFRLSNDVSLPSPSLSLYFLILFHSAHYRAVS